MNDLLKFMHDTMGDTARISASVKLLKDKNISEEERNKLLGAIENSNNHLKAVLDQYYLENKEQHAHG